MSWFREWKAIEKSVSDFSEICSQYIDAKAGTNVDSLGTAKRIIYPMASDIHQRVKIFGERYKSQLSEDAMALLDALKEQDQDFQGGFESSSATLKLGTSIAHFSAALKRFCSDFNYLTSDLEGVVVRLTVRAFVHLQRSIVADSAVRNKWILAKKEGEESCEKLGAVHLLQHGIWSFKANSAGERTDLVLGEPIRDNELQEVYLTAEGLVLTEWKLATNEDRHAKCQAAFNQAKLYAKGSLSAIELKRYRYLVIVSDDYLDALPERAEEDSVIYEYINIATNPSPPSKIARRMRG